MCPITPEIEFSAILQRNRLLGALIYPSLFFWRPPRGRKGIYGMHAKMGDWVQIHKIVLTPEQRTGRIPEDTKKVPFESWNKG